MPDYLSNDPSIAKGVERSIVKDVDTFWPVEVGVHDVVRFVSAYPRKLLWGHALLNQVDRFWGHSLVKVLTGNLKAYLKTCGKAVPLNNL